MLTFDDWCALAFVDGENRALFRAWLLKNSHSVSDEKTNTEWWDLWHQFAVSFEEAK